MLYKLNRAGVKNISTAIDYLTIYDEYHRYDWIKSCKERKEVVASKCKISVASVEKALFLMNQDI